MKLSKSIIERARLLRSAGMGWERVATRLGTTEYRLRCEMEPGFKETRRHQLWMRRHQIPTNRTSHFAERTRVEEGAFRQIIASVPPDTRNFTAWAMGDPLPGRSALDKRLAH